MEGTAVGAADMGDMGEGDVLAFAEARARRIRADKTDLLRAAYQVAVIHDVDGLGPDRDLPGRQRAQQYGGEGTPEVLEFAAATLGARIGVTTWAAAALIGDALDLHHRAPALWAALLAGTVDPDYARRVVKRTRSLTQAQVDAVVAAVIESCDARIPWGRFDDLLTGAIVASDVEAAREAEEVAATTTTVTRVRDETEGMATLLVRGPLPDITRIQATLGAYADAIAGDFPHLHRDALLLRALVLLCTPDSDHDPHQALADHAPVVELFVHTYAGDDHAGINRVEGYGPVTDAWVRDRLGPHARFNVHPVIDIPGMAPVDAYEIPGRHRQAVRLMTPADVFPYGSSLSRDKQIDHTRPYQPGGPPGQSGIGNYGPLTVGHHRVKTHGRWAVQQPFPGIYIWRDPHGAHYLVDHTGTRRLGTGPLKQNRKPVMEIYRQMPEIAIGEAG